MECAALRHRRLLETAQFGKLPFEPSCVCFALAGGGFRDSPGVEELRRILIEFPDPGFGDLKAFGGNFGVEFLLEELLAQFLYPAVRFERLLFECPIAFFQKRIFLLLDALVAQQICDFRRGGFSLFGLTAKLFQFRQRLKKFLLVSGGLFAQALKFDEVRSGGGFPGGGCGRAVADQFLQRIQFPVAVVDPALNDALVPVRPRLLHIDVVTASGVELVDRADVVALVAELDSFFERGVAEPPGVPRGKFGGGQRSGRQQDGENKIEEMLHEFTYSRNLWRSRGVMVNTSSSSPRSL